MITPGKLYMDYICPKCGKMTTIDFYPNDLDMYFKDKMAVFEGQCPHPHCHEVVEVRSR